MSIAGDDLPAEVLEQIASFLDGPVSVCRMSLSCPAFAQAVREASAREANDASPGLWDVLYRKRWTFQLSSSITYTHEQYKNKHLEDGRVLGRLVEAAQEVSRERDFAVGTRYQGAAWMTLLRETESFNLLRSVAKNEAEIKSFYGVATSPLIQCLAVHLMDFVHFTTILKSFDLLLTFEGGDDEGFLEEGSLLITQSSWTWEELLIVPPETHLCALREKLDGLGRRLQQRLEEPGHAVDGAESTVQAILIARELLNEEVADVGETSKSVGGMVESTHYVRDYSLDYVLHSAGGAPFAKLILYQLILRRVGVQTIIADDQGERLLRVPGTTVFVDVIKERGRLPPVEASRLARLPPWSQQKLVRRLAVLNYAAHVRPQRNSGLPESEVLKPTLLFNQFQHGHQERQDSIRYWQLGHSLIFRPQVFRHFNLIGTETA